MNIFILAPYAASVRNKRDKYLVIFKRGQLNLHSLVLDLFRGGVSLLLSLFTTAS